MKLIYIANARIPTEKAHGIHIMKMCETFASHNDIEVMLIVPKRFNKIKKDPFDYYGVARSFKLKKLPCLDLVPLDKCIGHLGLWVTSLSFAFFSFFYILFQKTDIIYTRDKFLLPLSFFKRDFIFEAHTFPKNYFFYALFLKKLKRMVVITQKLRDSFIRRGMFQEKILVAPDGVDLEKFDIKKTKEECRKKLVLPIDKKIALYAGHLYEWKGVTVLLEVARKVQDILFVFVGGTKEDIESFEKKVQGFDNVMIVGHKLYKEMPDWLKSADVLILPNSSETEISKYWTSPMKMFEYMASKRPIIASALSSISEILNNDNAILVEPDNSEALSRGIKEVLQNTQLSNEISAKAFQDVQQYTWQERVNNILKFIRTPRFTREP